MKCSHLLNNRITNALLFSARAVGSEQQAINMGYTVEGGFWSSNGVADWARVEKVNGLQDAVYYLHTIEESGLPEESGRFYRKLPSAIDEILTGLNEYFTKSQDDL